METTPVLTDIALVPLPAKEPAPRRAPPPETPWGMFDLILRGQAHLTATLRDERALPGALQKLLLLSLLGLGTHGLVVGLTAQLLHAGPFAGGRPVLWMPIAFVAAFVGALCVCLPSFYFYTQLSGLDASFRLVTAQALRGQATAATLLLGVTPFYAAAALGSAAGVLPGGDLIIVGGMAVPFVVGLFGVRALYLGFCDLAAVLPISHRRRGDFLRRMVLCWAVVYTAVAPVALYRLCEALSRHL
jgi:hypothetical protein